VYQDRQAPRDRQDRSVQRASISRTWDSINDSR
jgi:hypothetical protein